MTSSPKVVQHRSFRMFLLKIGLILLPAGSVMAWVYPEHRDIALLALQLLDTEQRASLDKLWSEARIGHEERLCSQMADSAQDLNPKCIDFAAWTAIAGDHSCSAGDMLSNVLDTSWIIKVAGVSAELKSRLAVATRRDQRENAVRDSDFSLVRVDPEYVTRAGSNNAHFLFARSDVAMEPEAYAHLALGSNAELNALGAYMWYHLRALAQATRIAHGGIPPDTYPKIARAALADEAFALHFLEDGFAAGHVAGSWGDSSVRKGTHDYYSEHGLEVVTWDHRRFVVLGDAYMRPADAEIAAAAVRDSLAQLVSALQGKMDVIPPADLKEDEPEGFSVCHAAHFPSAAGQQEEILAVVPIIAQTPMPALGPGPGELPRFRSELGPFIGLSTAVSGGAQGGGFGSTQTSATTDSGLDAAVRVGVGLEGVLNQSSDGLAFLDVGVRLDSPTLGSGVPGRGAFTVRLRAPFWLVPGDLIVATPVLALTAPQKLQKMAVESANGGLIPWQSGRASRIGRFQFVLGREVAVSLYGYLGDQTILIPTPGVPPLDRTQILLRSIQFDLPVLERRLFRTFSLNQSSGLTVQFNAGFDKPMSVSVVQPEGAPRPDLHIIVNGGVRVVFDWRRYLH